MPFNRLAFAALAVACIGAAAAGGYFGTRQTAVPAAQAAAPAVETQTAAATPVRETEAVVGTASSAPVLAEAPAPAPAKRAEPAAVPRVAPQTPSRTAASSNRKPIDAVPADRTPTQTAVNSAPPPQSAPPVLVPPAAIDPPAPPARGDDRAAARPPVPPTPEEPPQKSFEELTVVADSVIGLQSETSVTSERARVEDRVEARVARDVRVHDAVAIPAGSRALGTVVSVERGGRLRDRARLGIRFNTLVLADGTRVPISTETIYREGAAPGQSSAAKIGGATVGGAILGAIIGGGKGAAIGAAAGAGAGGAAVASTERQAATLQHGEPITVRILSPVTVTVEQK